MSQALESNAEYWSVFYSSARDARLEIPSQFAPFALSVALEVGARQVVDFGCGNGRDTLFFGRYGIPALGVDESPSAIEEANRLLSTSRLQLAAPVSFMRDDSLEVAAALRCSSLRTSSPTMLYARFFLHSIGDRDEAKFLNAVASCTNPFALVAFEFRTSQDAIRPKVMPDHARRYVDANHIEAMMRSFGYRVRYRQSGCGYAVWGDEDAHVARLLFSPV